MAKNNVEIVVTAEDRASGVLRGISGAAGTVAKVAGGVALGGIAALAGGFALAGRSAISMNAQLETSTLQFETLMGDAGRAEEHVKSLFDFAAKTPFETGPIIEASRLMQVFGGDALNTDENLTRIGDTAAAVGAPIDKIGFWVGRAYAAIQGGQPFGEAAASLMDMGAVSPAVIEEMKALQEAGASADEVFAVLQGHMDGFAGAMEKQAGTWEGLKSTIVDNLNMAAATALEPFFELAQGGLAKVAEWLSSPAVTGAIATFAEKFGDIIDAVKDFVTSIANGESPIQAFYDMFDSLAQTFGATAGEAWKIRQAIKQVVDKIVEVATPIYEAVTSFVSFKDVLIGLGIVIAAALIPAVVSLVTSMAPIILVIGAVVGAVALLRNAWENNWGGIQEKVAAAWAVIQPLLQQAWDWLQTNIPLALETLRSWWVDTAWPAIQTAIETVWPVIEGIFQSIRDWVMDTLIPTIQDLYEKWTTEWWPTIQTVLENVWTVIETVFAELQRWVNDNIIPIVEHLYDKWVNEWWPAIQKALETAWAAIEPLLASLKSTFETVMGGVKTAIQPALDLWDKFVGAVQRFWDWISSKTFDFKINLPNLPDWAVPGSPLPIHTAWVDFGRDMRRIQTNIGAGTSAIGGRLTGGVATGPTTSSSLTVNVDARGASRGVERDVRAAVEQVLRDYGVRADLRMRTG